MKYHPKRLCLKPTHANICLYIVDQDYKSLITKAELLFIEDGGGQHHILFYIHLFSLSNWAQLWLYE